MSLLSPAQIHKVLREQTAQKNDPGSLADLLEKNNLSADEVLMNLGSEMRSAEQASVRVKAAEIALKLNGLLSGDEKPDFHVTIVISDSEYSGQNPILFPR